MVDDVEDSFHFSFYQFICKAKLNFDHFLDFPLKVIEGSQKELCTQERQKLLPTFHKLYMQILVKDHLGYLNQGRLQQERVKETFSSSQSHGLNLLH